jgi:hypothetical protein
MRWTWHKLWYALLYPYLSLHSACKRPISSEFQWELSCQTGPLLKQDGKLTGMTYAVQTGQRPLHIAVVCCTDSTVDQLLAAGAKSDCKDRNNSLPIHLASASGRAAAVRALLKHGAAAQLKARNSAGQTALHCAVLGGYADLVSLLVAAGAYVNTRDQQNRTPADLAEVRTVQITL